MRTIEVTDKQYEQLKHMAELMHEQDNRATANPIFCVYKKSEVPTSEDYSSNCKIVNGDYDEIYESEEAMIEAFSKKEEFMAEYELLTEEEYNKIDLDWMPGDDICELMEWQKVYYNIENVPVTGQYYFTEEECHRHIKANSYHYTEPFSFVESAWRNPEMQLLREVVMSLVKKEEVTT